MNYYQTKANLIPGSNYKELKRKVDSLFSSLQRKTKRQPYIRSAYFNKQKIFFNIFWTHLFDKSYSVREARLKLLTAGIELLTHSRNHPFTVDNQKNKSESLHRFYGQTNEKVKFVIQLKEIKSTGKLYLMSIYPV